MIGICKDDSSLCIVCFKLYHQSNHELAILFMYDRVKTYQNIFYFRNILKRSFVYQGMYKWMNK